MADVKDLKDVDLYGLLNIQISATTQEIKKAYRKKALQCHPDKNPDNPKAAELFHQLSKALEILCDKSAREAYDRILNAKKAAELRHKELDSKRQKLKSNLEAREQSAVLESKSKSSFSCKTPEEQLQAEIERLRKEGSKLVEEEKRLLEEQLLAELNTKPPWNPNEHRIKIKWQASKSDQTNGGYNQTNLTKFLSKYGDINVLVLSTKNGSAVVEFQTQDAAEMAVEYELGLPENKLKLEWIGEGPKRKSKGSNLVNERDFESLVLRQMRQAEERKRLIQQMQEEDG
ncbi:dnaJ homolog subfamily C member 17-like [Ctenocephalides felis]|uniref:dnaJ homolog subfamily C member 17-like n=1 Tax=Ctenocephalides felis TaxID=7515 RepID=UPI000E6E2F62|nr:dnaJ homolog subfamily C member 17-like [Ctenocephalides felis]